jgi:IS605 OrfB family transposase
MRRFAVRAGMVVKGWTVRLEADPAQATRFRRDCGARRYAYNWAVTQMGDAFDRGHETGDWDSAIWSAYSLRKQWNQVKAEIAPWWAENSKEAKTHGRVVIEDLGVQQLARGLRSHRKSWIDASAGELRRQLAYKAAWYGCELWIADRWYPSSKTCSACGHINADLMLADRVWECPACGAEHDRDENAGTNLARLPASWAEAQSDGKTGVPSTLP